MKESLIIMNSNNYIYLRFLLYLKKCIYNMFNIALFDQLYFWTHNNDEFLKLPCKMVDLV